MKSCILMLHSVTHIYRRREGNVFSLFTTGGGTPVPGPFPVWYPSPRLFLRSLVPGGYSSSGFFLRALVLKILSVGSWLGVLPVPVGRYPRTGASPPPVRPRLGYPQPEQGWGTPPPPTLVRTGIPLDRTAERVLATRRAACLIRARRMTFLFP